jgi:S1-C subfamily serine protease
MGADYAFNSGILTRVGVNESHTDAYVGLLYTSMGRLSDDHGFLFDSGGALVGIPVNDSVRESQVFYGISDVKRVIEALVNGVPMAYFGVMGETVTGTLANRYSLPLGVYVTSVEENSPAFAVGIQAGDVITAVDDESILTFNEFSEKIYKLGSGQKTTINVKRRARDGYYDIAFTVTLANKD